MTSADVAPYTVTSVVPTLVHRVVGIPTNEIGWVAVRTTNTSSVRSKVGTDAAVTQNVIYGPSSTPNAQGDSKLTVSGLTADTQYYYRIVMAANDGSEYLDSGTVGKFRTAPVGQASFAFNFGSCCNATDSAAMAAIAARDDALFFHLGDLYYADGSGTDVSNFRSEIVAKIQAPNHAAVFHGTALRVHPFQPRRNKRRFGRRLRLDGLDELQHGLPGADPHPNASGVEGRLLHLHLGPGPVHPARHPLVQIEPGQRRQQLEDRAGLYAEAVAQGRDH